VLEAREEATLAALHWPEADRDALDLDTASEDNRKEYREGPEVAERFDGAVNRLLKVSKDELTRREAAYKNSLNEDARSCGTTYS
jgi:hypothetical protein